MKRSTPTPLQLMLISVGVAGVVAAVTWMGRARPASVLVPIPPDIDLTTPEPAAISPAPDVVVSTPSSTIPPLAPLPSPSGPSQRKATKNNGPASPVQRKPGVNEPAPDAPVPDAPVARQALALVGFDPVAEAVWLNAINDPATSAHDRSDLIEDLNEEGFADPKDITPDDLPLIVNRLALIEDLAPDAMDDVNADAFAEAYKDLRNMYTRLAGR